LTKNQKLLYLLPRREKDDTIGKNKGGVSVGLYEEIDAFSPCNEQEMRDKAAMLTFLRSAPDALARTNLTAHFTASAWVLSPARDRVLMLWHNIYKSWSWSGGHADGEEDLFSVARREVQEETGLQNLTDLYGGIFSLESLTVDGHEKNGAYVPSHLHYNVTYLLGAQETALREKRDENSGVAWMTPQEALEKSTEPWMVERIYRKLIEKSRPWMK
jgi:8-oxo-dGTP pyrophosphatase MutT (NUDIX family)